LKSELLGLAKLLAGDAVIAERLPEVGVLNLALQRLDRLIALDGPR
jgi:hypothetical protein